MNWRNFWEHRPPHTIALFVMFVLCCALMLGTVVKAFAVETPDEQTKIDALKLAYELNGKSMVRWGSIDLSGPPPETKPIRTIPIVPEKKKRGR